jgi:predicted small lipoprotein YifL
MTSKHWLLVGMAAFALSGCGQKGPLYMPEDARDIVTRPSSPPPAEPKAEPGEKTEKSNSPATVDSPIEAPAAPEVTGPAKKKDGDKNASPPVTPPQK